jgi:CMP-N-acetylneuraminic acid synthetase
VILTYDIERENEMKIVAVMPIKMNNERLPGKNTKLLGEKPLLQYELGNLIKTNLCDSINVFCSDDDIRSFLPTNVNFIKRPDFLDLPTSNFSQIFENFMKLVSSDIYVYAHATAPFISVGTMRECILAVKNGKYDSAFCAVKIQDYLWQDGEPLNFDATNVPRSQDIKPIFRETSGVYVFRREVFEKYHRRIGENPYVKEVTYKEAVDINNPEDFKLAQAMLNIDL